jgi:hypothetical protein
MVTWWASPIDQAMSRLHGQGQVGVGGKSAAFGLARMDPVMFGARGVVPLGYAVLAFALGVTAGVLLRRTLAAMAVTLVVFAVLQFVVPNAVRPHLLPPAQATAPVNLRNESISLNTSPNSGRTAIQLTGKDFAPAGSWVLSNDTITPSGAVFTVPPKTCTFAAGVAPGLAGLAGCRNALAAMHLRQVITYQPASRFWPLQGIETGLYLILAAGLGWLCVSQVRRRRTP